jgi:uncharacterized membrane protein
MPNLHPLAVHFPIALLTASLVLDLAGLVYQNSHAMKSGWWLFAAGSLGLAVTVITGLLAKSAVIIPDPALTVLGTHQELAFISAAVFAALLFWRIGSRTSIPPRRTMFMSLYATAVLLMWLGALQGGKLVYHYGVGVRALVP